MKTGRKNRQFALSLFAIVLLSPLGTGEGQGAGGLPSSAVVDGHAVDIGDGKPNTVSATPKKKAPLLTVQLSSSSLPHSASSSSPPEGRRTEEEERSRRIPLVGIGVGSLPHAKIPYILASALSSTKNAKKNKQQQQQPPSTEDDNEDLSNNYRLIDTSRDSALEALLGRSLSRLSADSSATTKTASTVTAVSAINDNSGNNIYHVMIKIYHTHLGYDRTMLSVHDSLSEILPGLSSKANKKKKTLNKGPVASGGGVATPDVRVHAIIQYPRCYEALFSSPAYLRSHNSSPKYTSCQEEETALFDNTDVNLFSDTGAKLPSPLLDKEGAWKRSYRALEEMYHHGTLESIGISNFGPQELLELFEIATVGPHVYQGSLRTLLTMEETVEMLVQHGVHYQCYDAVSAVLAKKEGNDKEGSLAPRAFAKLQRIGAAAHNDGDSDESYGYSPVQVVLGWLLHHKGVGVVPGTTDAQHLAENSPLSLGSMPKFSPREALDIENAVTALVTGVDIPDAEVSLVQERGEAALSANAASKEALVERSDHAGRTSAEAEVVATFFNALPQKSVRIFHVHPHSGEQMQISHSIPPGRSGRIIVNREDVLIAYDGHGVAVKKFLVEDGTNSGNVDFSVESS